LRGCARQHFIEEYDGCIFSNSLKVNYPRGRPQYIDALVFNALYVFHPFFDDVNSLVIVKVHTNLSVDFGCVDMETVGLWADSVPPFNRHRSWSRVTRRPRGARGGTVYVGCQRNPGWSHFVGRIREVTVTGDGNKRFIVETPGEGCENVCTFRQVGDMRIE
jgi:hypothetical protein